MALSVSRFFDEKFLNWREQTMSVDNIVILKKEKMITPFQWQQAIEECGFDLQLDTDFDVNEFIGYLPCVYRDEDTGFEY